MRSPAKTALALALALGSWGCAGKGRPAPLSTGECEPPPIELFLQPDAVLNLNEAGHSMPVEVRVLLLKDRLAFEQLDFESFWRSGEQTLAKDLIRAVSLTAFPGGLNIYPMKSDPAVAFVALVALFRQPQEQGWSCVVDIRRSNQRCAGEAQLHTLVPVVLRGNRISLTDQP